MSLKYEPASVPQHIWAQMKPVDCKGSQVPCTVRGVLPRPSEEGTSKGLNLKTKARIWP